MYDLGKSETCRLVEALLTVTIAQEFAVITQTAINIAGVCMTTNTFSPEVHPQEKSELN